MLNTRLTAAALLGLTALAACEPYPQATGCEPITDSTGRVVVGCSPDGQPVIMAPQPQTPPATRVPPPVQSGPIGGTVASGAYGPVPTVVGDTGEPLPPPPATLTPITPGSSSGSTASTTPNPATTRPPTDPDALPPVVAPPPGR